MQGRSLRVAVALAAVGISAFTGSVRGGEATVNPSTFALIDPSPDSIRPLMLDNSMVNPADERRAPSPSSQPFQIGHMDTWEMPAVTVVGQKVPELHEEERIGSYEQPRWTADRRFSETRIYVIPQGKFEFEYWFIPTIARHGPSEIKQQFEVELGLPGRFQLDLYLIPVKEGSGPGSETFLNNSVEVRYALADWGKIWGNPTFYVEYTFVDRDADELEVKLLLGDEFAPRWHWGVNLSFEHALGGDFYNEYEVTSGLSYTLVDEKLSIGLEEKANVTSFHNRRSRYEHEQFLGPSIQYRPLPPMHIDFAPLIGIGHESPMLQAYLVVGWEF